MERPYSEDPQLGNESDPAYREELFQSFKAMGWMPDDVKTDDVLRDEYAAWMKKQ